MMRPLTYGSIGQCVAAPFVLLTSAWVLGVFHSYRRQWLSVDLFLLAISAQELVMALQVFIYALMSLVQPDWDAACGALVWSLNATRTLQFATVMSLLADRALTCHWPYRYRFSVRRHQLRYHLAVLAAMASLLGVAALITRPHDQLDSFGNSSVMYCATMPYLLNIRLSLFLLAVYGVFLLAGMLSVAVVQTSRGCFSSPEKDNLTQIATNTTSSTTSTQRPPLSTSSTNTVSSHGRKPVQNSASRASSTSSSVGTTGNRTLRAASSTADLLPVSASARSGVLRTSSGAAPGGSDFRWRSTVSVALLCCLCNHLPYLTLVAMGTFTPRVLPPFPADHLSLWLSLAEGLLLPFLLLTDRTFRSAVSAACRRTPHPTGTSSAGQSFKGGEAPFRLFPKDDAKVFPLTNGSLFSSLLSLPAEGPSPPSNPFASPTYRKDGSNVLHMGLPGAAFRALDLRRLAGTAPTDGRGDVPYNAPYYCRDLHNSQDPLYANPTNNASTIDSSIKEDHIYATLSETFGSMSSFSDGYLNDDNRCPSVTTVANDDFEFHDPRTSGCSIDYYPLKDRNPCLRQQSCSSSSFSSSSELLSYGSRVKDDDTLVLRSPRKPATRNIGRRPPAELPPEARSPHLSPTNVYGLRQFSNCDKPLPKVPPRNNEADLVMERNRQNVMNSIEEETTSKQKITAEIGYDNVMFESDTLEKKYYMQKHATDSVKSTEKPWPKNRHCVIDNQDGTLSRKHRVSSLSMSDLDRLERKNAEGDEDQMMFLLPVKSESMLSLYRLYLAEDEESSASLHYSIEVSKSENDLSVAWHGQNHSNGGRSRDDISSPHEIYQKRRRPQSSASKGRRQHKIQRAKGVHMKSKAPSPVHRSHDEPHKDTRNVPSISQSLGVAFGDHTRDGGMRVAIVDKARRQNGIITIRDPSGLSVQELFSVLNRAATSPCPGDSSVSDKNSLNKIPVSQDQSNQLDHAIPTYSYSTPTSPNTVSPRCPDKMDTVIIVPESDSESCAAGTTHEFKKIFLSEYL